MKENLDDTKELITQKYTISGLYYRYKNRDNGDIKKFLKKCQIVKLTNNGPNTIHGYYPLTKKSLEIIQTKPRGKSLTFDAIEYSDKPLVGDLREYKKITYLVKSTSRFYLKPDIGEIIDQISYNDLNSNIIKAIVFDTTNEVLPNTNGEHFIMTATLLVDKDTTSHYTYNAGWICTKDIVLC